MARKDALLRLHQRLAAKREALRRKLAEEMNLPVPAISRGGDLGDAALDGETQELNSQLAALESRELNQIERAMQMIRDGRYGTCEVCEHSIPIARLQALPFTPLCVECQREQEATGYRDMGDSDLNWESAYEMEDRLQDKEVSLSDFEIDD